MSNNLRWLIYYKPNKTKQNILTDVNVVVLWALSPICLFLIFSFYNLYYFSCIMPSASWLSLLVMMVEVFLYGFLSLCKTFTNSWIFPDVWVRICFYNNDLFNHMHEFELDVTTRDNPQNSTGHQIYRSITYPWKKELIYKKAE